MTTIRDFATATLSDTKTSKPIGWKEGMHAPPCFSASESQPVVIACKTILSANPIPSTLERHYYFFFIQEIGLEQKVASENSWYRRILRSLPYPYWRLLLFNFLGAFDTQRIQVYDKICHDHLGFYFFSCLFTSIYCSQFVFSFFYSLNWPLQTLHTFVALLRSFLLL